MAENTSGSITPKNWFFGIIALIIVGALVFTFYPRNKETVVTEKGSNLIEKTNSKTNNNAVDNSTTKKEVENNTTTENKKEAGGEQNASRESMLSKIQNMSPEERTALIQFEGKNVKIKDIVIQMIDDFDASKPVYMACGEGRNHPGNGWLNGLQTDEWSKWELKKNSDGDWVGTMPEPLEFNLAQTSDRDDPNYCMIHYFRGAKWYKDGHSGVQGRSAIKPPNSIPEKR